MWNTFTEENNEISYQRLFHTCFAVNLTGNKKKILKKTINYFVQKMLANISLIKILIKQIRFFYTMKITICTVLVI